MAKASPVCSSRTSESSNLGKANLRIGLKNSKVDSARQMQSWRKCALRCHSFPSSSATAQVLSPEFAAILPSATPVESSWEMSLCACFCCTLERSEVPRRCWTDPTRSARGPLVANLAAFWQQISPIVPVLPTVPAHKSCAVYNLAFEAFHGMEASF